MKEKGPEEGADDDAPLCAAEEAPAAPQGAAGSSALAAPEGAEGAGAVPEGAEGAESVPVGEGSSDAQPAAGPRQGRARRTGLHRHVPKRKKRRV
jgi:hypothetical protein